MPISSHQLARDEVIFEEGRTPIKRKQFIIKREKPQHRTYKSRILHEKNVLTKFKSALAIFIPRYFFIYDPPQENIYDLIQEHIYIQGSTLNLEEYIKKFKTSTSQQTIIFFAYMLVQGLRCLKDYKIAHLDLKPSNVMIGKKMAVKIIDFGESFYPGLKSTSLLMKTISQESPCLTVLLKTTNLKTISITKMTSSPSVSSCTIY